MSQFQLPPTSFGPTTANPITASRASVPGVSGSMGSGLSGAGKKTIDEQINEAVAQLAAAQYGTPSHAALSQKLTGLLQLRQKAGPLAAPGAPGAPVDAGPAPVQGGGFGGGAAPTGKVITGSRPQTPLELMRSLSPSHPMQQRINELILAAEATSNPTLQREMTMRALELTNQMAHENRLASEQQHRTYHADRFARQQAAAPARPQKMAAPAAQTAAAPATPAPASAPAPAPIAAPAAPSVAPTAAAPIRPGSVEDLSTIEGMYEAKRREEAARAAAARAAEVDVEVDAQGNFKFGPGVAAPAPTRVVDRLSSPTTPGQVAFAAPGVDRAGMIDTLKKKLMVGDILPEDYEIALRKLQGNESSYPSLSQGMIDGLMR